MTQKRASKIGFISALSICFTSIVGIGIFLKNASIGKNVEGNGVSWLLTWIIAGALATLLAFHFGKIARIESTKNLTGLSAWVDEIVGKQKNTWFKKIATTNYGFFYNPILAISLSFFCAEFFMLFLQTINPELKFDLWVYVIVSLLLSAFFIFNNYFSVKFSGYISITTTILKFIPLFMVIFIGLIFFNSHNITDGTTSNGFDKTISFERAMQGIVLSIPSTFFAFDSFIGVGSWSKDIKGGSKAVSKVIVVAISLVTIVYCLVCLASIFHYNTEGTTVVNVLIDSLPKGAEKGITIFVILFVFISAFGTSNSIFGTSMNEFRNMILENKIAFTSFLSRKYSLKKSSLILCVSLILFWSVIIFVPSIIINNDSIIDGFSNLVVVYIFLIYAYLIFTFWRNVYKKEDAINTTKTKAKIYAISVWISLIGTALVSLLNVYYVIENAITNPASESSWGLFLSGKGYGSITNMDVLVIYIVFSSIFFIFPFVNHSITNRMTNTKKLQYQ